ncbi:MAG: polysaccharide deacetylase family protein [Polyangiaceae bacterium]
MWRVVGRAFAVSAWMGLTAMGCAAVTRPPQPAATHTAPTSEPVANELVLDDTPVDSTAEAPAADPTPSLPVTTRAAWSPKEPVVAHEKTKAIVLMYHSIDTGVLPRSVSPKMFESHLQWLEENHVEVVPLSTFVAFLDNKVELPERVAVITIDDGERSFYRTAYPTLVKHHMPFTLGLPTAAIEQSRERPTFTWDMVRDMLSSGLCEIASHSHTHPNLARLSPTAIRRELQTSRDLIEKNTGIRPASLFYPMGSFNKAVLDISATMYEAGFVAVGAPVKPTTPRYRIPRYEMGNTVGLVTLALYARRAGLDVRDPIAPRKLLASR